MSTYPSNQPSDYTPASEESVWLFHEDQPTATARQERHDTDRHRSACDALSGPQSRERVAFPHPSEYRSPIMYALAEEAAKQS